VSANPRHVLMTTDTVGGVWTYSLELAGQLAQRGTRVTLVSMGVMPDAAQRAEVARLSEVSLVPTDFRLEWMPDCRHDLEASGEFLTRLEGNLKPDIVHINGYWHAALSYRAPVLAVAHSCVTSWFLACRGHKPTQEFAPYEGWVRDAAEAADLLVAPTAAYLRDFQRLHGSANDTRVIWNGRDANAFRPARKQNFVLAAGRLWDEAKNVATLCRAAKDLDIRVAVAGDGADPDGNRLEMPNVAVLGRLAPGELAQMMAHAAIFAAPARYEPFGLTILEAALSGCALVLGDIPSLRELWDGVAVFVPPDDESALRDAISWLSADAGRSARLGHVARQRGRLYSATCMADAYCDAYRRLLQRQAGSRLGAVA
jgi:glycogen synthase